MHEQRSPGSDPQELEMTLDGEFVSPPKPPLLTKLMFWAIVIAVLGAAVVIAALALWLAIIVLPVVIAAALLAYALWRYRLWRAGISVGRAVDPRFRGRFGPR